ncbi:MAG: helicase DnaB [Arcobacter sp.]|uniref:helicase DnaB n=1 Tax=Arcobacter sp. TaxID=1872629 RepID=UPI003D02820B
MTFEFLRDVVLTPEDFNIQDQKVFIEDFLYSNTVTVIYSPPKQGKTWLGYGLATTVAKDSSIEKVLYFDMDNSLNTLKDRAVNEILLPFPKIEYVSGSKLRCSPMEHLRQVAKEAVPGNFIGVVFFLETTKDYVDTDSKAQSEEFMKIVMKMRDAGATIIIMHHATKTGRTISGVQVFINSPDNVYELIQKARDDNNLHFMLNITHARNLVKDTGLSVNTRTLKLEKLDDVYSTMSEYEESFVRKAKASLEKATEGLSQTELLKATGHDKTDKTARDTLEKYVDKFWTKYQEKKGKPVTYKAI